MPFSFFHDTPPTEMYTLSLHDALPIYEVLTTVDPVGHRRGDQMTAHVEVPESFTRGGIHGEKIAGIVRGEKQMPSSSQDSGDGSAVAELVIPHDFAGAVVKRT